MTQEELKTCLGQLLNDLRCNWAYDYSNRLNKAMDLCNQIQDFTEDVKRKIEQELEEPFDGRTFRGASFYGYSSEEGVTEEVKKWLENNLSHPEYCSVLD